MGNLRHDDGQWQYLAAAVDPEEFLTLIAERFTLAMGPGVRRGTGGRTESASSLHELAA